MRIKACSLFMGYREYEASLVQNFKGKCFVYVEGIGQLSPMEYVRHGFRVMQAKTSELEALVAAGYESRRLLMRFYDTKIN